MGDYATAERLAAPTAPETGVTRALEAQAKELAELHAALDALNTRLEPIQAARPRAAESRTLQQPESPSSLAGSINLHAASITKATQRVHDMIESLDL